MVLTMRGRAFLAFDLGAASGRAILGRIADRCITLHQLHRFPNHIVNLRGRLHWNVVQLFQELKAGLAAAAHADPLPESAALDTWGVDFALLGPDGSLLGVPYSYRDPVAHLAMPLLLQRLPRERIYQLTGIQFLPFNTLFQLFSLAQAPSSPLHRAADLLFIPDLFNYWLTGRKLTEFTFATTSQLYNPLTQAWEPELFRALDLPLDLMQTVVPTGAPVGPLDPDIAREVGLPDLPFVATASHDTAAAVAAVPGQGSDWAYISSGTWSLMGAEVSAPVITDQARDLNFTNEGGVGSTFRLLRNIMGFWLLEQCRAAWRHERDYTPKDLSLLAADAPPFRSLIEPDHPGFLAPPDMPQAIADFCRDTGQPAPQSPGDFARAIFEGLALKYRLVLDQLRSICPSPINHLHIVGGGAQNQLFCQFTADATGLPVTAGPVEAAAVGNLLVQALARGHLQSLDDLREVVRASFSLTHYQPRDQALWGPAYARFQDLHRQAAAQGAPS
jgi:rhamnulokinase